MPQSIAPMPISLLKRLLQVMEWTRMRRIKNQIIGQLKQAPDLRVGTLLDPAGGRGGEHAAPFPSSAPHLLATLNQLQANITREVAQIDPAMMRRSMLDMRARAVKCIAAGTGHFEKQSSDQLFPCLVTEKSLLISWKKIVRNR